MEQTQSVEKVRTSKTRAADRHPAPSIELSAVIALPLNQAQVRHYPAKIKLLRPYGWYDDDGTEFYFLQDFETDVPEQIQRIIDRGCADYIVLE